MLETSKVDLFVSVVVLMKDQTEVLTAFVDDVYQLLVERYTNFEILLIDNGSQDNSSKAILPLLSQYKCVRYLRLSRPVDDETVLTAGLDVAIGDFVVTVHPDFDPHREIVPMVEMCRSRYDAVLGVDRTAPPASRLYRTLRAIFVVVSRWVVKLQIPVETTEFRVFSRSAVNALTRIRARRRFFSILASDIGLITGLYPYDRVSRSGVPPARSLSKSVRTGMSVLLHYSILPLRLVSFMALAGGALSLAYSLYVVVVYLIKPDVAAGWTTLSLQVSGLFSLAFLILALLGECVGRLMEEGLDRPLYHVRDEQSSSVMLSNAGRRNVLGQSETLR